MKSAIEQEVVHEIHHNLDSELQDTATQQKLLHIIAYFCLLFMPST